MLIGSGPIVIGQACEFDYSGTQGVKALQGRGLPGRAGELEPGDDHDRPGDRRPHLRRAADRRGARRSVIERERPDALLPTLGGQTALNLALELHKAGVLAAYGVKLIGAQVEAIEKAEDRELFKQAMEKIGLDVPLSGYAHTLEEARTIQAEMAAETGVGYPVLLRPSFTLGGSGAAIVWNAEEFDAKVAWGLHAEPARRGAGRAVGARLEGIRARGDARHARTTPSSSARSRTSIRWACTPATRSPSRRR